jgi:acetyl esterase/lipase
MLSRDYALALGHPFPVGLEDAAWGYEWIFNSGIKPEHVAIAGGGLAVPAMLTLRDQGAHQHVVIQSPKPPISTDRVVFFVQLFP